jgi:hypothetical protein
MQCWNFFYLAFGCAFISYINIFPCFIDFVWTSFSVNAWILNHSPVIKYWGCWIFRCIKLIFPAMFNYFLLIVTQKCNYHISQNTFKAQSKVFQKSGYQSTLSINDSACLTSSSPALTVTFSVVVLLILQMEKVFYSFNCYLYLIVFIYLLDAYVLT